MLLEKVRNRLSYLRNKRTIRRYDSAVDHRAWSGAEFHEAHFTPFPLPKPAGPFSTGVYRETVISAPVGELAAKFIGDFRERIVGHLGARVRLDDIYLFWYDPALRDDWSYSGSWHDDNVGHRLKLFACFEGDGSTPTVVIPNSFNKPYSRRPLERDRFSGVRDTRSRLGEIRLAYRAGDVAIFDTSCLHRGLYEEPAARRVTLVMEFIDRDKCNAIAGGLPCAPGMSPIGKVLFDPAAYSALDKTGFLDPALIAKEGLSYSYSLANRS